MDLCVLALRCGLTHVLNFSMGPSLSLASYPFLSSDLQTMDIHTASHWFIYDPPNSAKEQWYKLINRWHMSMFARLLEAMQEQDGTGSSLLDRSVVVGLSELSWGGTHDPYNLPVLLAGAGVQGGQSVHFPCGNVIDALDGNWHGATSGAQQCSDSEVTPLANLWLTLLRRLGAADETFGKSTGTLDGLWM